MNPPQRSTYTVSTTPAYSGTTSTNTPPMYTPHQSTQSPALNQSSKTREIDYIEWLPVILGIVISGIVGYFMILMTVKDQIAENKQHISVVESQFENMKNDISDSKSDLKLIPELSKSNAVLEVKIENLENQINKKYNK